MSLSWYLAQPVLPRVMSLISELICGLEICWHPVHEGAKYLLSQSIVSTRLRKMHVADFGSYWPLGFPGVAVA